MMNNNHYMWWSNTASSIESGSGCGWVVVTYTLAVVTLVYVWQIIIPRFRRQSNNPTIISILPPSSQQHSCSRISSSSEEEDVITDLDLKLLMDDLDDKNNNKWESVVDKRNNSLTYSVKCCKPKDGGPLKYLSTTLFNSCSSEILRDFYMDNFYRKEWDKTLIDHQQLQVNPTNGTEFGSIIKKFPLLTPREYILAWRLWQGTDTTTCYCYSKECDHPLAPRQKKYVRVGLLRSGWRIREAGRNSCEIKMVHQEDAGLNVEMAKVIFAKGIWSYVCKMDNALRKYTDIKRFELKSTISAITLVQKVPLSLDSTSKIAADMAYHHHPEEEYNEKKVKVSRKPSKKLIANGLILVGGVICLARGHTNFTAKVAMAYALSKLKKRPQNKQTTCLQ